MHDRAGKNWRPQTGAGKTLHEEDPLATALPSKLAAVGPISTWMNSEGVNSDPFACSEGGESGLRRPGEYFPRKMHAMARKKQEKGGGAGFCSRAGWSGGCFEPRCQQKKPIRDARNRLYEKETHIASIQRGGIATDCSRFETRWQSGHQLEGERGGLFQPKKHNI